MKTPATLGIPFEDGMLAVRDYGGEGQEVLLAHALGMCAMNWDGVAEPLTRTCRVLAIDLPGHGKSTCTMRTPFSVYECLIAVAEHLGIRPLLVGHDQGSLCMVEAVSARPDLFVAGVAVGGSIVRTREEMAEICEFAASDYFKDALRTRFCFGVRGVGRAEADRTLDVVVLNGSIDWITTDLEGLRAEREYSLRWAQDGSWVHQPEPEDVAMVGHFPPDHPFFPCQDLAGQFRVPVWIVQLSNGYDVQMASRENALAAEYDVLRLVRLESGQWPQYSEPEALTEVIAAIAQDPAATTLPRLVDGTFDHLVVRGGCAGRPREGALGDGPLV